MTKRAKILTFSIPKILKVYTHYVPRKEKTVDDKPSKQFFRSNALVTKIPTDFFLT